MKPFIQKVQDLGQKAAQLRQAVQSAPARAAEIREAVAATAGQLQQLRTDVQASVDSLRTEGEAGVMEALRELDQAGEVFLEAGYQLREVEMELGIAQRLIVHLEKVEDLPPAVLRSLLVRQEGRKTVHAILGALIRATDLSGRLDLDHLIHHKLTVYAGLTPSVRLGWAPGLAGEPPALPPSSSPNPPSVREKSAFSQSSFFERPAATVSPAEPGSSTPTPPPAPAAASVGPADRAASPETATPAPLSGDWRRNALDRFKKMPDLSRSEKRPGSW